MVTGVFHPIGELCTIFMGVAGSGRVRGVQLSRKERDMVGVAIDSVMHKNMSPAIKHNLYKVLVCVWNICIMYIYI